MGTLSSLRNSYMRQPLWLQRSAQATLKYFPQEVLLGRDFRTTVQQLARANSDTPYILRRQHELLEATLRNARRSKAFSRRLTDTGDPWLTLATLPILTKADLQRDPQAYLTMPQCEVVWQSTSGSSGEPLQFAVERDRSGREWAFISTYWRRLGGYRLGATRAVLRGIELRSRAEPPWDFDPLLGELRISTFYNSSKSLRSYCEILQTRRVRYIHGYPSAVDALARFIVGEQGYQGWAHLVGAVFLASEPLFDYQRQQIASAFPSAVILPHYGLSEKVAFAEEVPGKPGTFDFHPLYGFTELVDDAGEPVVTKGEMGRIVSTGINVSRATAFLRYDTGDRAKLVAAPDASNGFRLRLCAIQPRRSQEFLIGSDGSKLSMTALNIHSAHYAKLECFQFEQRHEGKADLMAVLRPGADFSDLEAVASEMAAKTRGRLTISPKAVHAIPAGPNGKRPFIKRIDDHLPAI
jgi:phenylacetate-CoA ligase